MQHTFLLRTSTITHNHTHLLLPRVVRDHGQVGAQHRCEWCVMGPSVNLAARLMGKSKAGSVLMEAETFARMDKAALAEFSIELLSPVVASCSF